MRTTLLMLATCLVACGTASTLPDAPTIALDREPATLPAAYVGTTQQETLQVLSRGVHALVVTRVELTSDSGAFGAVEFSPALPATLDGTAAGFLRFTFKPTKPGKFEAKLVIESNSALRPKVETTVTGCAVAPGAPAGC